MSPDLATLVGSRICHDLISPIGAIGNGVELLQLTDGDTSAEVQLISDSVASANARIRFFRIAFGAASDVQVISRAEVLSILSASALGGRFTYFWQLEHDIPRTDLRLVFLLLQCMETALPLGGEIEISGSDGSLRISATGKKVAADNDLWGKLTTLVNDTADVTAAQVHFALVPTAAAQSGRSVTYQITDERITIAV